MITVITNKLEIERLHKRFHQKLNKYFNQNIKCVIGYPGGSREDIVKYSPELKVWISILELNNRYWNGFGISKPGKGSNVSLVGEINFPYEGIDRRIAGVFAKEENGNILILHRGKIGGGRKGIGKSFFVDNFSGEFVIAIDGKRETEFCLVGELNSIHFLEQVSDFINEIQRVKNIINNPVAEFNDLYNFSYTNEHFGRSVTERNEPIVINRVHGIVVGALRTELENHGHLIANDKNRDLFIHKNGKIKVMFEIKTSSSTQNIYSATGQLLIYSIPIQNEIPLIAVFPNILSQRVVSRLSEFGIQLVYYNWVKGVPKFKGLEKILSKSGY